MFCAAQLRAGLRGSRRDRCPRSEKKPIGGRAGSLCAIRHLGVLPQALRSTARLQVI